MIYRFSLLNWHLSCSFGSMLLNKKGWPSALSPLENEFCSQPSRTRKTIICQKKRKTGQGRNFAAVKQRVKKDNKRIFSLPPPPNPSNCCNEDDTFGKWCWVEEETCLKMVLSPISLSGILICVFPNTNMQMEEETPSKMHFCLIPKSAEAKACYNLETFWNG